MCKCWQLYHQHISLEGNITVNINLPDDYIFINLSTLDIIIKVKVCVCNLFPCWYWHTLWLKLGIFERTKREESIRKKTFKRLKNNQIYKEEKIYTPISAKYNMHLPIHKCYLLKIALLWMSHKLKTINSS